MKIVWYIKDMILSIYDSIKYDINVNILNRCPYCGKSTKKSKELFRLEHFALACWYKECPHCKKEFYTRVMI